MTAVQPSVRVRGPLALSDSPVGVGSVALAFALTVTRVFPVPLETSESPCPVSLLV